MLNSEPALVAVLRHLIERSCKEIEQDVVHRNGEECGHYTNRYGDGDGSTLLHAGNGKRNGKCSRGNGLSRDGTTDVDGAHENRLKRSADNAAR